MWQMGAMAHIIFWQKESCKLCNILEQFYFQYTSPETEIAYLTDMKFCNFDSPLKIREQVTKLFI